MNKTIVLSLILFTVFLINNAVAATTYTPTTETTCNGNRCTMTFYGGVRYVQEDGKWKSVNDARSLKESEIGCSVVSDGIHQAECLDWNLTSITIKTFIDAKTAGKELNNDIPIVVWSVNESKIAKDLTGDYKKDYLKTLTIIKNYKSTDDMQSITIPFGLGKILEFGNNSTTIMLNESGTDIERDTYLEANAPDLNHGAETAIVLYNENTGKPRRILTMVNISKIPAGQTIIDSKFVVYGYGPVYAVKGSACYHVSDNTWNHQNETNVTWNNAPSYNATTDSVNDAWMDPANRWYNWTVSTPVSIDYYAGNLNVSFLCKFINEGIPEAGGTAYSREYSNIAYREYLNITYELPVTTTTTSTTTTLVTSTIVPSCYQDVATFNDSTSSKNITFTGSENQTVWIRLPKPSSYLISQLNLSSLNNLTNPYLDVANDSDIQWSYSGGFNQTNNRTSNFVTEINNYLYNCTPTIGSFCDVPLLFHSDSAGLLQVNDINISCNNPLHSTISYTPISGIGYNLNGTVNISVTDIDTYQYCNISINNQNYTNIPFSNNQTSYQFNWTDGLNVFTVNCIDSSGVYSSNIATSTAYIKRIDLIDEDTGNIFSNFTQLSVLRAIDESNQTIFNFLTANSTWVYIANSNPDAVIRIEKKYTDTLFVDLKVGLLPSETRVCVANTQQFYEIIFYSKQSQPIALKNYLGNCYVLIGDTRYAYQDALMAKAYTIRAGYGLYTVEADGTFAFLSSVDGGLAAAHDIDVIEFNKNQPSYSLISDQFGYESTSTSFLVYYTNQKEDNLQVDVVLKNSTSIWGIWNETLQPNNFTVTFSTAGSLTGLLTLDIIKHKGSGIIETVEQTISYGARVILTSGIAIIFSVSLTFFGLTFVATKYSFGWFGIIVMIISLAITTLAPATASLRLIQAVDIIMLTYIILIYKEENIRAV